MTYLLDSHTFLWWNITPAKLSTTAQVILANSQNAIYLSVASAWEIQIKAQLGKLVLPDKIEKMVQNQRRQNGLQVLPLRIKHVAALASLPFHHKDPFDRMLIAQTLSEGFSLITNDQYIQQYAIPVIW